MKIVLLLCLSIFSLQMTGEKDNSLAKVEQAQGMYIFYRSAPVSSYDYIGTYKIGFIMEEKPKNLFDKLIRKTKDKFPTAEGIIISAEMDKADAIKFK